MLNARINVLVVIKAIETTGGEHDPETMPILAALGLNRSRMSKSRGAFRLLPAWYVRAMAGPMGTGRAA